MLSARKKRLLNFSPLKKSPIRTRSRKHKTPSKPKTPSNLGTPSNLETPADLETHSDLGKPSDPPEMADIATMEGNFPVNDLRQYLSEDQGRMFIRSSGNLDKKNFSKAIIDKREIPPFFLKALKDKYPSIPLPEELQVIVESTVLPPPADDDEGTSDRHKRKFSWFLDEWAGQSAEADPREEDGTLKALNTYDGPVQDGEFTIDAGRDIPEQFITDADIKFWDSLFEVNGKAYYNAEELALGSLKKSEYLLIPSNWAVQICPIADIGAGLRKYKVPMSTIAGVYVLAKQQAKELDYKEDDQVKWAVLRMEAVKSGWFAKQKYTRYKKLPANYMSDMRADYDNIVKYSDQAYTLCAFLPFMCEYYFRSFGSAFTSSNAGEYIQKATTLATSANISDCLAYMTSDILHGKALAWIGVKRPMEALRDPTAFERIPHPFQLRAYAAPAGQALITSSLAVIESIQASGWWGYIKRAGGYNDELLVEVGREIAANPWKFHVYCSAYDIRALTRAELSRVDEAKKMAAMFSPLLQAYIQTLMQGSQLSGIKSIKKHAMNNPQMLKSCCSLFKTVAKAKFRNLEEVFATNAFRITSREDAEGAGGAGVS